MPYAINVAGTGWRAIDSEADLATGETFSIAEPELLPQAQASQISTLQAAFAAAVNQPVAFTNAAGVASSYPSGKTIQITGNTAEQDLSDVIDAGAAAWQLGKWLDVNGVAQTFTFADLEGLVGAMAAAETTDYRDLIAKIAEVQAATTIAAVQAITF